MHRLPTPSNHLPMHTLQEKYYKRMRIITSQMYCTRGTTTTWCHHLKFNGKTNAKVGGWTVDLNPTSVAGQLMTTYMGITHLYLNKIKMLHLHNLINIRSLLYLGFFLLIVFFGDVLTCKYNDIPIGVMSAKLLFIFNSPITCETDTYTNRTTALVVYSVLLPKYLVCWSLIGWLKILTWTWPHTTCEETCDLKDQYNSSISKITTWFNECKHRIHVKGETKIQALRWRDLMWQSRN